jgi:acetylornithine deacetylase/succinyl-diaminopimelate desuccinylase-like protein
MAKISMRLVPDQDPIDVHQQLQEHLEKHVPHSVKWELDYLSGSPGTVLNRDTPGVQALSKAFNTVWGRPPVFAWEGGSVPVVGEMQKILGIDSILTGFGLPDDHIHSPNERLHLPTWTRGIDSVIHFLYNL